MMTMTDIVKHLRSWGLKVSTEPGYKTRGRPYAFHPRGVLCHHTASSRKSGNFGSEYIVTHGRSDLPGPLCQFLLGRDGQVKVIALGYANHAGVGGPHAGIPANMGNTYLYGIEAENDGVGEPWPKVQLNAYYRLCAALLKYMNITDVNMVFGHKEWTTRKIDPARLNMDDFRRQVKKALAAGDSRPGVRLSSFKIGKRNHDVLLVKNALEKRGFGKATNAGYWGKGVQSSYAKYQKSLGYTGSDANGVPGEQSLNSLGFKVISEPNKSQKATNIINIKNVGPGKNTKDNLLVKKALESRGLGKATNAGHWGAGVQRQYSIWQQKLGYTGHDANGIPGKTSLEKLGFEVK